VIPANMQPAAGCAGYALSVSGLKGGHSGAEIHCGRANAISVMLRTLYEAAARVPDIRLADLRGGRFNNVICPQCDAVVAVPPECGQTLERFAAEFNTLLRHEYADTDADITLTCAETVCADALSPTDTRRVLSGFFILPQGVQEMSTSPEGLVQTSSNMGTISMSAEGAALSVSVRSSVDTRKIMILHRIRGAVELAGGHVTIRDVYPGWAYAADSPIRDRVLTAYRQVTGHDGRVAAMHAGLECGLFAEKLPGLDAISLGPELLHIHSVEERLNVASTRRLYEVVCRVLAASNE